MTRETIEKLKELEAKSQDSDRDFVFFRNALTVIRCAEAVMSIQSLVSKGQIPNDPLDADVVWTASKIIQERDTLKAEVTTLKDENARIEKGFSDREETLRKLMAENHRLEIDNAGLKRESVIYRNELERLQDVVSLEDHESIDRVMNRVGFDYLPS
jgi:predicted RNase H-like nuclease (RuvC/YqgF family)